MNRYYRAGLIVGAVTPAPQSKGWSLDQYKALARKAQQSADVSHPFVIVMITRDGKHWIASPRDTREKAADLYGQLAGDPGEFVYLAFFDRDVREGEDQITEEAFFQPTDIVKETVKETVRTETKTLSTPVKAGIGIATALGLLALIAKH